LWTDLPGGSGIIKSFHNRCYAEVVWNKTGTSTIIDARTWYLYPGSMRQCKLRHVESCLCGKCIDWEDEHEYPPCEEKIMDRFRVKIGEYDWDYTTIRVMMGLDD